MNRTTIKFTLILLISLISAYITGSFSFEVLGIESKDALFLIGFLTFMIMFIVSFLADYEKDYQNIKEVNEG